MRIKSAGFLLCLLLSLPIHHAAPQAIHVGQPAIRVSAALGGSVTVAVAPAFLSFRLISNGVTAGSSGIGVTTSWAGFNRITRLNLYAYFLSGVAALSGGSPLVNIPSSAILGQVPGGSASSFTPFTGSNPMPGASLLLYCDPAMAAGSGSRSETLNLEIDLQRQPQLPAGIYTGTLFLEAQML